MMRRTMLLLASMALTLLVASGLALAVNKVGTDEREFLKGTDQADNIIGNGDTDLIFGLAGNDNLFGGSGKDFVIGGTYMQSHGPRALGGSKNLVGGDGNDVVWGGKGSDNVVGGEGNDLLVGGEYDHPVKDTLTGGDGNDVFDVYNDPAGKDVVRYGGGLDWVFADREDMVAADCEKVADRVSEFDEVGNSIPQSFGDSLAPPFAQFPSKPRDYAKAQGLAKAFDKANINPLVGDWRTKRTCDQYVSRLKQAGLVDQLANKTRAAAVGYGIQDRLKDFDEGEAYTRYYAPVELVQSNDSISEEFLKVTANPSQGKGGICFGDSGGPILKGDTILGVNSFVTNGNCAGVTYAYRIDTAEALAFIRSVIRTHT